MATTKVTTDVIDMSGNTGGLVWAKGTTAQRPAVGVSTIGDLRENTETKRTEVYTDETGTAEWRNLKEVAAGPVTVDFLVVAGGGAGIFGGGGGGGLRSTTTYGGAEAALSVTPGVATPIVVGPGGTAPGTAAAPLVAQQGVNSTFSTITSVGGGSGGYNSLSPSTMNGGSGGGGGGAITGSNFAGGEGFNIANGDANNQGFDGGIGRLTSTGGAGFSDGPGGGGGATTLGQNGSKDGTHEIGGNGGTGKSINITGLSVGYSGGGGGSTFVGTLAGGTSSDGGGSGGNSSSGNPTGNDGSPNKGGGGGGGVAGKNGGSGIVILRCTKATATISAGITVNGISAAGSVSGDTANMPSGEYFYSATLGTGTITFS
jgi:hypothetical protein